MKDLQDLLEKIHSSFNKGFFDYFRVKFCLSESDKFSVISGAPWEHGDIRFKSRWINHPAEPLWLMTS